jgi:hypothetical protein
MPSFLPQKWLLRLRAKAVFKPAPMKEIVAPPRH